jgi:hypothetical protein
MPRSSFRPAAIGLAVSLLSATAAFAYVQGPVPNGATFTGIVRLAGSLPEPRRVVAAKDVETCGDTLAVHDLVVGSSKGVLNAIVIIEGITSGKPLPPSDSLYLANRGCQFEPRVQVVPVGTRLEVRNDDPILHNTHAYMGDTESLFNIALPIKELRVKKELSKPGIVRLECDAGHTWMRGYVLVTEHPYAAVTDENGAFTISDIPPGTYTVRVWHETLGTQTRQVAFRPSETATMEFDLTLEQAPSGSAGGR